MRAKSTIPHCDSRKSPANSNGLTILAVTPLKGISWRYLPPSNPNKPNAFPPRSYVGGPHPKLTEYVVPPVSAAETTPSSPSLNVTARRPLLKDRIFWPNGEASRNATSRPARRVAVFALPPLHSRSISTPPRARNPRKLPSGQALGSAGSNRTTPACDCSSISIKPLGPPRLPSI